MASRAAPTGLIAERRTAITLREFKLAHGGANRQYDDSLFRWGVGGAVPRTRAVRGIQLRAEFRGPLYGSVHSRARRHCHPQFVERAVV